ncbi:MAG: hypothetical protein ABI609_08130 [Acidobacteriota bacterium]
MFRKPAAFSAFAFLACVAVASPAHAEWALRLGAGVAEASDTVLRDSSCEAVHPPALFGCGYRAKGAWGRATAGELAVGNRLRPDLRIEIAAIFMRGFALDANANFPRVSTDQPVGAKLDSSALLAVAYWDPATTFGWKLGRFAPFVGAGVGAARHHLGAVTFRFPGISPTAVTLTRGGRETDGAWLLTAGVAVSLADRVALDVAYRRLDLGGAETDDGLATIMRTTRTVQIEVASMRARVRADELVAGVRFHW